MGNKEVTVEGNNIIVDDVEYEGTPGLWSLIMQASPLEYTEKDLNHYKDLVLQTDVINYPGNVGPSSRPGNTTKRRLLETLQKSGFGIQFLPGDIKGLSVKLNLLLAEFRAGNKSTRNEIVSILDELLRRKRISRKEYTEINTYLSNDCNKIEVS